MAPAAATPTDTPAICGVVRGAAPSSSSSSSASASPFSSSSLVSVSAGGGDASVSVSVGEPIVVSCVGARVVVMSVEPTSVED